VWACGDAAGGMMQTPIASLQGQTVALSIATGTPHVADLRAVPIACFTTPQLATVGLTADTARQSGISVKVHRIDSDSIGAAIADDERDSFVQLVIGDDDGVVLGAQIAGPTASDTIYAAAVAIRARLTAVELQGVLGVHPSYAEAENYAAW
jgi:dihydrolipoamide dehydrogenase